MNTHVGVRPNATLRETVGLVPGPWKKWVWYLIGLVILHLSLQWLYTSYVDPLNRAIEADGHQLSNEELVTTLRLHRDEVDYYRIALNCLERHAYSGNLLSESPKPTAYRPPLFPIILAGVFCVTGPDPRNGIVLNALLITFLIPLVFRLGLAISGERSAILAATFVAIWPDGFYFGSTLLTEPLAAVACTAGFLALLLFGREPSFKGAVSTGFILGAALLARSNVSFILLMVVAWLIWRVHGRPMARQYALVLLGCLSMALLPWGIRNFVTMRLPTIGTTGSGDVFAGAHNDVVASVRPGYWIPVPLPAHDRELSEHERDVEGWRQGLDFIKQSTIPNLAKLFALKLVRLWEPTQWVFSDESKKYWNVLASLIFLPVVLASILGAFRLSDRRDLLYLTIAFALGVSLMAFVFCGDRRYLVPLHPIACAIAGLGINRRFEFGGSFTT